MGTWARAMKLNYRIPSAVADDSDSVVPERAARGLAAMRALAGPLRRGCARYVLVALCDPCAAVDRWLGDALVEAQLLAWARP